MTEKKTFYWYFRPIALVSKLFGVLPLQNLHYGDGTRVSFRYISIAHFYSTAVFFTVLFLLTYYLQLQVHQELDAIGVWKVVVVYVVIVRSIICFTFCVHYSKKLPYLIDALEQFDKKKYDILNVEGKFYKKFFKLCVFPFIQGGLYITGCFIELNLFVRQVIPESIRYTDQGRDAGIIFGILGNWQIVPLLLYIYLAFAIKRNFQAIHETLGGFPLFSDTNNEINENDGKLSKTLEDIRCLYSLMSIAACHLSDTFGNFMAIDQICMNIMLVINFYVFFFITNNDVHLLSITLLNFVMVLVAIMVSHEVKEHAIRVIGLLQNFRASVADRATYEEVQLFMGQVSSRPVQISAAGYFIMDRNQLASILSSVATYFVVLVQFAAPKMSYEPRCFNNNRTTEVPASL